MKKINLIKRLWKTDSHEKQSPQRFGRYAAMLIMLLTLGVGQMWANGGIGYKGVKFTKNGSATGWYNIHNVSWGYSDASYECRSGQSGVTDFNNANLGTVTTLKLKAFVVIGWTDSGNDYVAGQLKYRLYKQGSSAGSYSTYSVGNYGNNSGGVANVLASSGNNRVVGNASLTTDIVTSSTPAGNYYLQLQGLGRMQWKDGGNSGDFNANNGSEVKATLLVPGFTTTSTSNAYGSVNVGSNSSATISFTQHYGTTLTTSNCSLTNSTDFQVTGISETGVTVKFMPQTTGDKSCTLTITDANSKTCSISLTGTGTSASTATITYHENFRTETGNGTGSAPDEEVYALNATATVAGQNTMSWSYYTFSGWNTDEHITGDHYDEDDEFEITENMDLYATWTRSIPMDDQGATTPVSTTVYGTYNSTALTAHTNPAKTGYTFQGWYTQIGGGGNYVISTGHVLQASKTNWTNASGQFIRPSTSYSSLYAKWTQSVTLNANTANHGSGSNGSATATWNKGPLSNITHCTPAADFKLDGYYTNTTGGTKILNADGSFAATNITNYITSSKWTKAGATTLYAQYVPIPVKLLYGSSTPLNSPTDGGAMSYDATEHAYYKDVTTNSSPYYFRFDYNSNSEQYSGNWDSYPEVVEAVANGSKVDCNQTVKGWDNKGSIKFTGANGSSIRIWFDYQNKKAWITEPGYSVTINNGDHGTVSPNGVRSVGASGLTITATPTEGYKLASWNVTGGAHVASSTSATTTLTATADGTVTAIYETESPIRLYYSNPAGWSKVYAYLWDVDNTSDKNANFPGTDITTNIELVDCQQYYYYEYYPSAHAGWDRIIFNGGDGSKQTHDLPFSAATNAGQYQNAGKDEDGSWQDTSNPWYFAYNGDSWNTTAHPLTCTSTTSGYVELDLAANIDYAFKFVENGSTWYGCTEATKITYENKATAQTMNNTNGGSANQTIKTAGAGTYRFTWDITNKRVTVTYPTSYTVTFGMGTGGATITASATSAGGSFSSGDYVGSGADVTFTQTASTGYTFAGWYTTKDAGGSVVSGMGISDNVLENVTTNKTVWSRYTENMTTVNLVASPTGKGTFSNGVSAVTSVSAGVATNPSVTAVPATGYRVNTSATVWSESSDYISISPANAATTTITATGTSGNSATLTATFTPKTYTITLHEQGATTHGTPGDGGTITVTYDANTNLGSITALPARTGYTFDGYYDNAECTGEWIIKTDKYFNWDGTYLNSTTGAWQYDGNVDLYAKWVANQYTVTLDVDEANKGTIAGATTSQDIYFNDVTVTVPNRPTAANGYALDGYYTEPLGEGTKVINANGTWIASVDGYTNGSKRWIHADDVTLYAYYKKAEITSVTFDDDIVEPGAPITATANISPTPTGTTTVCWRLLHDNGNEYDPQPTFTPASGATVSFTVPETSTYYKVEAKLRTGNDCAAGTLLDTETGRFRVAGSHTVTVNYKYSSTTIKASTSVTATPLAWSDDITAPDIFGYTFSNWTAADGVTIKDSEHEGETSSTEATIKIQATYNGSLTANYTPKNIIYFKDNLEWTDPEDENAHIYVNLLTADYWNESNGTGNEGVTNRNLQMDRVPGTTDIFYYDYGSKPTSNYVSFTKESMDNYTHFYQAGSAHVVFPSRALDALGTDNASGFGFYAATPMFVPLATQSPVKKNGNHATYYNDGYWTKYLPGTGYTLQIYNEAGNSLVKEIAFTSADELMPMKVVTDLEGSHTYKFQLKRDGDVYYGNNGTMTYADHGQNTPWDFYNNSPFNMCTIETNAAGDYTFNLSYAPNSGGTQNRLRMKVDYPVANGDYRLVYTDDTRSYIVDAVTKYRPKPSAIVNKINDGTAIVSFFVRHDQNPKLYIQQASVNPSTGAITWNEYPTSGTPTNKITGTIASTISSGGTDVYNFNLSMNGSGALSVTSATKYTGNYYIRTDAANSKWDNYSSDPDHLMTYSEYSITHGGYTHYYVHWVDKDDTGRKNVKFVIANDYSPCISDTLAREEASGTWANIASFIEEGGDLKRSANVRFMWDKRDNSISRAYVDGAQGDYSTNFLYMLNVEASADKIKKSDGTALTDHKVTFKDNGNWMYEANIKAQPTARIKLLSNWGTENTITQYFRGTSETTEQLLGGSGSNWYDIRVIYDFKTNRLIAGLVPEGNIEDPMAIHADVMFIREHHGNITQLTFTEDGAITDIETAFGVLQLNKWTINNKSKAEGHAPLSPLLSRYERDLFYVSFPFRVAMEDVFGFGTYGVHWIIEYYDGASRAANGYWQESGPNWKFVLNRKNQFFEPNQGYIIAIELDEMNEGSSVWANTDVVELYFPSYGSMPDITSSSVTHELPEHECTINRSEEIGGGGLPLGPAYDRRVKDSHWNVMSVPTYVNPDAPTFANTDWITTADDTHVGPNFLYEWNKDDNTVTAVSGTGYTYHAMHAYLVQYCGNVTWTSSVSPASAPRLNPAYRGEYQFRLELLKNDVKEDQTFVKLSDNENVTTGFEFNYDLSKEFNSKRANIYTLIQNNESVENAAGNVLPLTGQKTIVPVGVQIQSEGEYTFSMPDGTEGIGITLIDNETGEHTNLGLTDYTVNLNAGTINERFVLEISPVSQTTTDIETVTEDGLQITGARKVMIDGILYIVRDGQVFDARGARVQ